MSEPQQPVREADLQASVDARLSATQEAAVRAWLREHPQDAQRLAQYRRQNEALRAAYDPILNEPVPAQLQTLVTQAPARSGGMRYAAMLAVLMCGAVIGGVAGWMAHGSRPGQNSAAQTIPAFAQQAAIAHAVYTPEVRHPVEVGADQETHLVAWLSKRLGTPLRVPDLKAQGYALVGGRLLPGQPDNRSPVAQFMYESNGKKRLTLYVHVEARPPAAAQGETAFRFAQEKNVGVFYWVDENLGYALSGDIEKADLLRVANAVYQQLQR